MTNHLFKIPCVTIPKDSISLQNSFIESLKILQNGKTHNVPIKNKNVLINLNKEIFMIWEPSAIQSLKNREISLPPKIIPIKNVFFEHGVFTKKKQMFSDEYYDADCSFSFELFFNEKHSPNNIKKCFNRFIEKYRPDNYIKETKYYSNISHIEEYSNKYGSSKMLFEKFRLNFKYKLDIKEFGPRLINILSRKINHRVPNSYCFYNKNNRIESKKEINSAIMRLSTFGISEKSIKTCNNFFDLKKIKEILDHKIKNSYKTKSIFGQKLLHIDLKSAITFILRMNEYQIIKNICCYLINLNIQIDSICGDCIAFSSNKKIDFDIIKNAVKKNGFVCEIKEN